MGKVIEVRWWGHACVEIVYAGKRLMIDPHDGGSLGVYVRRNVIPNASIIGNAMLNICGVDIAVIVNNDLSRVSLRSQRCDVRTIAAYLGGGGHEKAAGAEIRVDLPLRLLWKLNIAKAKVASVVARKIINLIEEFKSFRGAVCVKLYT
ncbi:MAG TPA: hypothetical protein EYP48_00995 [Ignisphaera sp.]|nr:hypothetical protein [Ignisphaera sp.]